MEAMYRVTSYAPEGSWGDYTEESDIMTETEVCRLLTDFDCRTDEDGGKIAGDYLRKSDNLPLSVRRL